MKKTISILHDLGIALGLIFGGGVIAYAALDAVLAEINDPEMARLPATAEDLQCWEPMSIDEAARAAVSAATQFSTGKVVTAAFMNTIYYRGLDGGVPPNEYGWGHQHDGNVDAGDGHAGKILLTDGGMVTGILPSNMVDFDAGLADTDWPSNRINWDAGGEIPWTSVDGLNDHRVIRWVEPLGCVYRYTGGLGSMIDPGCIGAIPSSPCWDGGVDPAYTAALIRPPSNYDNAIEKFRLWYLCTADTEDGGPPHWWINYGVTNEIIGDGGETPADASSDGGARVCKATDIRYTPWFDLNMNNPSLFNALQITITNKGREACTEIPDYNPSIVPLALEFAIKVYGVQNDPYP